MFRQLTGSTLCPPDLNTSWNTPSRVNECVEGGKKEGHTGEGYRLWSQCLGPFKTTGGSFLYARSIFGSFKINYIILDI